jgi:hypothetical protein
MTVLGRILPRLSKALQEGNMGRKGESGTKVALFQDGVSGTKMTRNEGDAVA